MKIKRPISVILTILLFVLLFNGCSSSNTIKGTDTSSNPATDEAISQIKLPIVDKPLTLSLWAPISDKVTNAYKSYGDLPLFKEMETRTGIHINFLHPPVGQETDQLNLMLASNDLPDILQYDWGTIAGGPAKILGEKQIIKLNDYVDKYAPNMKKLMLDDKELKKQMILDDGTFYSFPYLTRIPTEGAWYGPQMRKDWLDKLQLKAPTTIDEWHDVLVAFRDKDPNGNGKNDEIPFVGKGSNGLGILSLQDLTPAWGVINDFTLKDGKVVYGPIESQYKDFLTVMASWYKEKLIDQDLATNDSKAFDYKITNNVAGSYYGSVNGNMGRFLNMMQPVDPKFNLTSLTYPVGPAGKPYTALDLNMKASPYGSAITSKCKNIKEAIEWLDYGYSVEGGLLFNFGIEGKSYTMVNGIPTYTDLIWKPTNGDTWDQVMGQYTRAIDIWSMDVSKYYTEQKLRLPQQKDASTKNWLQADSARVLPPVTLTDSEARTKASIMNQVETYRNETMGKIVMGKLPVSDFDKYVQTIKSMGIDQVTQIENDAYQRYLKR